MRLVALRSKWTALLLVVNMVGTTACSQPIHSSDKPKSTKVTKMTFDSKPLCIGYLQLNIPVDMRPDDTGNYRVEYNAHYFNRSEWVKDSAMATQAEFDRKVKGLARVFQNTKFTAEDIAYNKEQYQAMFKYPDAKLDHADLPMTNALYEYAEYSPTKRVIIGTRHINDGSPDSSTYSVLYSQLFFYSPIAKRYVETSQVMFKSRLAQQRKAALKPFVDSIEVDTGNPAANQLCVGPVLVRNADQAPTIEYGLPSPMIQGVLSLTYTKAEKAGADGGYREKAFNSILKGGVRRVFRKDRVIGGMRGVESCVFSPKESEETNIHPGNRDRYLCGWYYSGVEGDLKRPSMSVRLDIYKVLADGSERSEEDVLAIWEQIISSLRYRDGVMLSSAASVSSAVIRPGSICPTTGMWYCEGVSPEAGIYMRKGDPMPGQSYNKEARAKMEWHLIKPMGDDA